MATAAAPEKKRRFRWLRFSTRTPLAAITVVAVWLGIHTERVHRQRQAVARVCELGGFVTYDYGALGQGASVNPEVPFRNNSPIDDPPGPAWLRRIVGDDFFAKVTQVNLDFDNEKATEATKLEFLDRFPDLESLYLGGPNGLITEAHGPFALEISDASLARIGQLSKLTSLTFDNVAPSPSGFVHLAHLRKLEDLYLSTGPLAGEEWSFLAQMENLKELALDLPPEANADDAMRYVENLHNLKSLRVRSSALRDSGLSHVANISSLEFLELRGSHVTSVGMSHLAVLPRLKTLRLQTATADADTLARLQERMPELVIRVD